MKKFKLAEMTNGWFIGNFTPSIIKTGEFEVAVKTYRRGDHEPLHHHKRATEITVISSGKVRMNGVQYEAGDIILIEPMEATDFEALTDVVTTVVKYPGSSNDKYMGKPND